MTGCHQCGKCCRPVPFTERFFALYSGMMQQEPVEIVPIAYDLVLPVTATGRCVFQREDGTCAIHLHKPRVCREYLCTGEEREDDRMVWSALIHEDDEKALYLNWSWKEKMV